MKKKKVETLIESQKISSEITDYRNNPFEEETQPTVFFNPGKQGGIVFFPQQSNQEQLLQSEKEEIETETSIQLNITPKLEEIKIDDLLDDAPIATKEEEEKKEEVKEVKSIKQAASEIYEKLTKFREYLIKKNQVAVNKDKIPNPEFMNALNRIESLIRSYQDYEKLETINVNDLNSTNELMLKFLRENLGLLEKLRLHLNEEEFNDLKNEIIKLIEVNYKN